MFKCSVDGTTAIFIINTYEADLLTLSALVFGYQQCPRGLLLLWGVGGKVAFPMQLRQYRCEQTAVAGSPLDCSLTSLFSDTAAEATKLTISPVFSSEGFTTPSSI